MYNSYEEFLNECDAYDNELKCEFNGFEKCLKTTVCDESEELFDVVIYGEDEEYAKKEIASYMEEHYPNVEYDFYDFDVTFSNGEVYKSEYNDNASKCEVFLG